MKIDDGDGGVINVNVARYDWAFDEAAGSRVQRFSRELPPEVWLVGEMRGAFPDKRNALVSVTFPLSPLAHDVNGLLDEIAAHFPAFPPGALLDKLRALAPKTKAA